VSRSTSQPPTLASTLPPERSTLATARPRLLPVRLCLNMSVANNPTMLPGSANLCLFALRPRPWKQRQGVRRHHRHWQARSRWNGRHWLSLDLGCCWYALTHTAVSIMKRTQPIELCSHLYNPQVLEAVSRSTSPPPTLASTLPLERSTLATARPRLLLVRQFAARVSSASGSLPSNNRPWKQRQGVRRHHRHWQARSRWNGRHWIPLDLGCCWYAFALLPSRIRALLISIPTSYPTTGPGSSVSEYVATTDIGKHAPAGTVDTGYRSTSVAAGTC